MDENEVAAQLLDEHGAAVEAAGAPRWLQVRVDAASRVVTATRIEPEGWLGHDLPAGWQATAVVATGRVHALDPSHELPASVARAQSGGMRMCCVVSRAGRVGWKVRLPPTAGSPSATEPGGHPLSEAPTEGMMLDVLLRAAGHPTPAPSVPAGDLLTLLWIEALLCAVDARPRWRAEWPDMIGLHPALPLEPDTDPDEAEAVLESVGAWASWEDFRRRAVELPTGNLLPPAELARWMDEGIFSRWVMEPLPALDQAMRQVRPLLDSDAYHRLRRLSRSIGDRTSVR